MTHDDGRAIEAIFCALTEHGGRALLELRRMRSTVVIVTHLTHVLSQVDRILLLVEGKLALYGPRDQVTSKLQQAAARVARPASANRAADAHVSIAGAAND